MDKIEQLVQRQISPGNLNHIYDALHNYTSSSDNISRYERECILLIETIIEYLLYGDKSDSFIFDTFCEYNFMAEFLILSNASNRAINLQIIKSFALLVANLTNKQTIYFLFSNNFLNKIISHDYDKSDSDYISYYVNFIKSLSLKIDELTIQLFFYQQKNQFPLLDNALKLYNYPDPMIINVVRNIFLTILKTNYPPVLEYVCSLPSMSYLIFISCRVRDLIQSINDKLTTTNLDQIKYLYDEVVNDIMFLQDIFSLKIEKINYILTNALFHYVILPLLCCSLISSSSTSSLSSSSAKKKTISSYISLNMLILFAFYITDEAFLNCLFSILFCEKIHCSLFEKIKNAPKDLNNYQYKMDESQTFSNTNSNNHIHEESFHKFISYNFSEKFIKTIPYMNDSSYKPLIEISSTFRKLFENPNSEISHNDSSLYKTILTELSSYFNQEQTYQMSEYHHMVSVSSGVGCGLTFCAEKYSPLQIMERMFKLLSSNPGSKKLVTNDIRFNILLFLKSKDDSLIFLSALLISLLIKQNKNISPELLSLCKLLPADQFYNSNSSTNDTIIVSNSISENVRSIQQKSRNYDNDIYDDALQLSEIKIIEKGLPSKKEGWKNEQITLLNISLFNSYPQKYYTITYSNNYFFNKFSVNQTIYDKEVLSSILSMIDSELIYRSLTFRIIIEITERLILPSNSLPLNDPYLIKINKAYKSTLIHIKKYMQTDPIIKSQCSTLFEDEWSKYHNDMHKIINDITKEPYLLYPIQYEESLYNYPLWLKIPRTSTDKFSSYLLLFMVLNDFCSLVTNDNNRIKDKFPMAFAGKKIKLNDKISLQKIPMKFNSKLKKENDSSFINYTMFIFQNYLIFTTPDIQDPSLSIVKRKYPLRHLEVQGDRSEPRNLIVYSREGKSYIEIYINLEKLLDVSKAKSMLEEERKNVEDSEYILIEAYFNDKLKSCDQ